MKSLDKVIKGLEHCSQGVNVSCYECPYRNFGEIPPDCVDKCRILQDAVELLKEQETNVSIVDTKIVGFPQGDKEVYCCGDCKSVLNDSFGFCPFCGAKLDWSEQRGAVKWDE